MSGTIDKQYRPIVKQLEQLGYRIVRKGTRGHPKVLRPDGTFVAPIPTSSGDQRGVRNFISQLRRAGVDI